MPSVRADFLSSLFAEAGADLNAYVARKIGPQDAADVVQDTWIRLAERCDVEAWREPRAVLFATAGNLAVDHWRRQQRQAEPMDPEFVGGAICPRPGPEAVIASRREAERLAAALDELPAECRQAFLLNRLDGLSHKDIADRLGVSTKTVQRHIERALGHCLVRLAG